MQVLEIANRMNNINNNPYFQKLNSVSVEKFLNSQKSFICAVDFWSKILGSILTILPTYKERVIVIENLYDEHGCGDVSDSHVNTFKKFMESLGYKKDLPLSGSSEEYSAVNEFNSRLVNKIGASSWVYCVSMLGMIEYTYIDVSRNIHNYASNFIDPKDINHYSLHEIVDVKHATDLFRLVEPYYDNYHKEINEGLQYGYICLNDLYKGLSDYLK